MISKKGQLYETDGNHNNLRTFSKKDYATIVEKYKLYSSDLDKLSLGLASK